MSNSLQLMVCSLPGSSVQGIPQARILERVSMPSFRGIFWPRDWSPTSLMSPALAGRFFTTSTTWEAPNGMVSFSKLPYKFVAASRSALSKEHGIMLAKFGQCYMLHTLFLVRHCAWTYLKLICTLVQKLKASTRFLSTACMTAISQMCPWLSLKGLK